MNDDPALGSAQPDPTGALQGARDASRRLRDAIDSGRATSPAEDKKISEQLDLYIESRYSQKFDTETKSAIIKRALAQFTNSLYARRLLPNLPALDDLPQVVSDYALDELSAGRSTAEHCQERIWGDAQLIVAVFGEHIHQEQVVCMLTKVYKERQVVEFQIVSLYIDLFERLKRRPRLELVITELRRSRTRLGWRVDEPLVQEMLLRFSNRLPGPGD